MGSRAEGTNPRAMGTNPRALEKFPVTPIKPKPREKWYAGKRFVDDHTEIVWATWEECKHLFQNENHSRCRGFCRKEDAQAWLDALPSFSRYAVGPTP